MVVLALDTTTKGGSCAVARHGAVLREAAGDATRPHDVRLPGDLMALVEGVPLELPQIDVYAVATGPGSFTGLRIGIATMQGLAFATGKPLIGVSAFDALVRIAARALPPRTAIWIDAWRGEVYAALYEAGVDVEPPVVASPQSLLRTLRRAPTVFAGDGADIYRDTILAAMGEQAHIIEPAAPPLAAVIATMATELVRAGHRPPPHAIRPLYVRRPDAELAREARPVR